MSLEEYLFCLITVLNNYVENLNNLLKECKFINFGRGKILRFVVQENGLLLLEMEETHMVGTEKISVRVAYLLETCDFGKKDSYNLGNIVVKNMDALEEAIEYAHLFREFVNFVNKAKWVSRFSDGTLKVRVCEPCVEDSIDIYQLTGSVSIIYDFATNTFKSNKEFASWWQIEEGYIDPYYIPEEFKNLNEGRNLVNTGFKPEEKVVLVKKREMKLL